jgi:soluble lytic murein transglycosylase-like protein
MDEPEAQALAVSVLEERGAISVPFILAVVEIESRYDKKAKSKKKCKGLMQLSKGTAKVMAKRLDMSKVDLSDIKTNVKLGVSYLAALLQENGSIGKALTIYNMGWRNFVRHGKKISGYGFLVMKRANLIKHLLENNLTCEK